MVRGVQQGFSWAPQVMARATSEKNSKHGVDTSIEVGSLSGAKHQCEALCCALQVMALCHTEKNVKHGVEVDAVVYAMLHCSLGSGILS